MDVTRSFKYVFEDKDWIKKVLIGGVLNIIPVIGQAFTMGYGLRQLKKMTEGQELPLPEWDDWGGDLKRGIMVLLGYLVYAVPIIVLAIFSGIFTSIGANAAFRSNTGSTGIWGVCVFGISVLIFILGVALYVWAPAALLNYVKNGEMFTAFFKFEDIWAIIKANTKEYITLILMALVAVVVAGIVGGIVCGVGALFTGFIATLVMMHLLGQFYNTVWGSGMPFSPTPQAPASDNSFQIPQ